MLGDQRVTLVRRSDHVVVESLHVVWAQKAPRLTAIEGEVEQGLVALALGQLLVAALRPDRFPDAPYGAAVECTLIQEAAPTRNDARRIAAQHVHVRELDARGIVSQRLLQQLDSVAGDSHKHGFLAGKRLADERQRAAEEPLIARIEKCQVAKAPLPTQYAGRVCVGSEDVVVTHLGIRTSDKERPGGPDALPAPVPAASTTTIGDASNEEANQPQQNGGDQHIPQNMYCKPEPAKYGKNQDECHQSHHYSLRTLDAKRRITLDLVLLLPHATGP